MKRGIWVLVALAIAAVLYLMIIAPDSSNRTGDPRTLGGPPAQGG
jgi:hypothetical protein